MLAGIELSFNLPSNVEGIGLLSQMLKQICASSVFFLGIVSSFGSASVFISVFHLLMHPLGYLTDKETLGETFE